MIALHVERHNGLLDNFLSVALGVMASVVVVALLAVTGVAMISSGGRRSIPRVALGLAPAAVGLAWVAFAVVLGESRRPRMARNLLQITTGGLLWGIVGMFLAAPITAAIRIVFMQFDTLRPIGNLLAGDFSKRQPVLQ